MQNYTTFDLKISEVYISMAEEILRNFLIACMVLYKLAAGVSCVFGECFSGSSW